MIKKLSLSICLFFFLNSGFALQKIYIFHINGVNTTQDEASRNRFALDRALPHPEGFNIQKVDLLYNKEDGASFCSLCSQLRNILEQKKFKNINLDDYVIAYIRDKKLYVKPNTSEYIALKNSIKDKYLADPAFLGNNFNDLLNQIHQKVTSKSTNPTYWDESYPRGARPKPFILFIPHSQGNLYANNLYEELIAKEGYQQTNLSIYGIASPADKNLGDYISKTIYGNPGYLTSSNDGVINALRILAAVPPQQTIAPANIIIPSNVSLDPSGHGLIPTYLSDPGANQQIVNEVSNILCYFSRNNL